MHRLIVRQFFIMNSCLLKIGSKAMYWYYTETQRNKSSFCVTAVREEVASNIMLRARESAREVTQKYVEIFKAKGVSLKFSVHYN